MKFGRAPTTEIIFIDFVFNFHREGAKPRSTFKPFFAPSRLSGSFFSFLGALESWWLGLF
jgi:hypothetical protein